MLTVSEPIVLCPLCCRRLFAVGNAVGPVRCDACAHCYGSNLGINDRGLREVSDEGTVTRTDQVQNGACARRLRPAVTSDPLLHRASMSGQ